MKQLTIEPFAIDFDELGETVFVMSCEQRHPRFGERFMKDMRYAVMCRILPDAISDRQKRNREILPMQLYPCKPEVIAVSKRGKRQAAAIESAEEFVIIQVAGRNH